MCLNWLLKQDMLHLNRIIYLIRVKKDMEEDNVIVMFVISNHGTR